MDDVEGSNEVVERGQRSLWITSNAISLVLVLLLLLLWSSKNSEDIVDDQLTGDAAVAEFLTRVDDQPGSASVGDTRSLLPTGVFVQSLRFLSASDVHITGYIWQRWSPELRATFDSQGIILPELVDSSVEIREDYRVMEADGAEVVGWYFEGAFRQPFDYRRYPFDPKKVWVRIWPQHFDDNLVLTPDFGAYPGGTDVDDQFGLEQSIVLGDWTTNDTYFDYAVGDYSTNFGISEYVGQSDFPELRFNVLLKRKLENAVIVNLAPLVVVAVLAFAAVLTVTRRNTMADKLGYNVSGLIGTVSALFFVILLSHIQLRQEFAGGGVTYLEYFYFLMYVVLIAVACNAFLTSTRPSRDGRYIHTGDNLTFKLAYWPALLGASVLITLLVL